MKLALSNFLVVNPNGKLLELFIEDNDTWYGVVDGIKDSNLYPNDVIFICHYFLETEPEPLLEDF